jgi:hypothetical protein
VTQNHKLDVVRLSHRDNHSIEKGQRNRAQEDEDSMHTATGSHLSALSLKSARPFFLPLLSHILWRLLEAERHRNMHYPPIHDGGLFIVIVHHLNPSIFSTLHY